MYARVYANVSYFNNRNQVLTAEILKQDYQYHKLNKAFSKFYLRHQDNELEVKYNVGLKTLLQQCILEQVFYGILW